MWHSVSLLPLFTSKNTAAVRIVCPLKWSPVCAVANVANIGAPISSVGRASVPCAAARKPQKHC